MDDDGRTPDNEYPINSPMSLRLRCVVGRDRDIRTHGQADGHTLEHTLGQLKPYFSTLTLSFLAEISISGCGF